MRTVTDSFASFFELETRDLASQKRDIVNLKCLMAGLDKKIAVQKSNFYVSIAHIL